MMGTFRSSTNTSKRKTEESPKPTGRVYKFFKGLDTICDLFEDWRVIPRVVILLYGYVFWRVVEWFMLLPTPTTEQVAFVSAIVGVAAAFFGIYTNGGGKNNYDRE